MHVELLIRQPCMQDTFALVYKIPYRRARAWPSGCIGRVRRASKGILHTTFARAR